MTLATIYAPIVPVLPDITQIITKVNQLIGRSTMQVGDKDTQRHAEVDVALGFNLCPIIKREPFV